MLSRDFALRISATENPWQAVGSLKLRQAPLARARERRLPATPDPAATARLDASLADINDDNLRAALARLGAAIAEK